MNKLLKWLLDRHDKAQMSRQRYYEPEFTTIGRDWTNDRHKSEWQLNRDYEQLSKGLARD